MAEKNKPPILTAALSLAVMLLMTALVLAPEQAYAAGVEGLDLWLRVVFPALLPFFILSELMHGLGMVDALAVLLSPVMGSLFRCPGRGAFVWAMSAVSGYPMGARLVAKFTQSGEITGAEGQRILSFASTSGPLFIVGAVATGMLGSLAAGRILLVTHYLAAVLLGLCFRRYRFGDKRSNPEQTGFKRAVQAFVEARQRDNRPLGTLFVDAVRNAVQLQLLIGGFILFFSVLIHLMIHSGLLTMSARLLTLAFGRWMDPALAQGLLGGLLEITVGCRLVAEAPVSMEQKIAAAAFLIGWSGCSIHGQSAGILSDSGIRFGIYLLGKAGHGLLAALLAIPAVRLFYPEARETFALNPAVPILGWQEIALASARLFLWSVGLLILAAVLTGCYKALRSDRRVYHRLS